ncbi:MAG: hypothetical protein AAF603_09250, partial [Pseudomonadota bacterium]
FPQIIQNDMGCATQRELRAMKDQPVDRLTADGVTRPAKVILAHPTNFSLPEREVDTCSSYADLKAENWQPMTTVGMVDESRFIRYCGLLSIAPLADIPRTSQFQGSRLTETEIKTIPADQWPSLGETASEPPIITKDETTPRRWHLDTPTQIMILQDIAQADFDQDGEAEQLIYLAVRARGGSAGFVTYGLLEAEIDSVRLRMISFDKRS